MKVYVLFVHKKSVSKRKVCIILIKNKKFKKTKKKHNFSVFFRWVFLGGFLLPTLPVAGLAGRGALPTAAAQAGPLGRRRCGAHQVREQVVETFVHFLRHLSKVVIKMGCGEEKWVHSKKKEGALSEKDKEGLLLRPETKFYEEIETAREKSSFISII